MSQVMALSSPTGVLLRRMEDTSWRVIPQNAKPLSTITGSTAMAQSCLTSYLSTFYYRSLKVLKEVLECSSKWEQASFRTGQFQAQTERSSTALQYWTQTSNRVTSTFLGMRAPQWVQLAFMASTMTLNLFLAAEVTVPPPILKS